MKYFFLFLLLIPGVMGVEVGASPSKIFLDPQDNFFIINSNKFPIDFEISAPGLVVTPMSGTIIAGSKQEILVNKGSANPGTHFIDVETKSSHGTIGALPALIIRAVVKESLFRTWHLLVISGLIILIGILLIRRYL